MPHAQTISISGKINQPTNTNNFEIENKLSRFDSGSWQTDGRADGHLSTALHSAGNKFCQSHKLMNPRIRDLFATRAIVLHD